MDGGMKGRKKIMKLVSSYLAKLMYHHFHSSTLSSCQIFGLCSPSCSLSQSPQIQILALIQGSAQVPLPWYQLMCAFS